MHRALAPALVALVGVALVGGATFAKDAAVRVFEPKFKEPNVAVAPSGKVFVVSGDGESVQVSASKDGRTWERPVTVARLGVALGMRRGPRIAATAKSLVVTAVATDGDQKGNVVAWRSGDEGATWQGPTALNRNATSAREGLQGLGGGAADEVACAWLDLRSSKTEVFAAVSTDGGTTWGEDVRVYASPSGNTCECCHPSVAWTAKGELAVMWRNWVDGSRDLWLATSKDQGKTFSKGTKLGDGTWPLKGCPMDGGAVAGGADGAWTTAWRREKNVVLAIPGKPERVLGTGTQPWVALGPGGPFTAWVDKAGGRLLVAAGSKEPAEVATGAQNPSIAGALDGKGPVVLTWASAEGVFARTLVARK